MFREPQSIGVRAGWIEVICGSMFSGKTEEIIRRLRRAGTAQKQVAVFKPTMDTRYHHQDIVSHNREQRMPGIAVAHASEISALSAGADVVGIDEGQFFEDGLPEVAALLAGGGVRVIIAGLDMDFTGAPFGPMPRLLAEAEYVTKLHAICACCSGLAAYSYRKTPDSGQILLGEAEVYEARCRACFFGAA